ncbi:pentapeptide repeat-containing protein [Calothrix sp. NIES-3974]|uniref:pentapeptide repeat-containing protein n=1 Tax=Calothrix sp. NIES-3974 TaxID=2005462 RepID=UPI000B619BF1|nr:pentapeptide repeat-containing protein [Calothrix sp. NIES-3974]BAZ04115.1 TPR domain protein [Calothrix sp. NIES-3974]
MIFKLQAPTTTSAIALVFSSLLVGCGNPEQPQATTPLPPAEQAAPSPVTQVNSENINTKDAVNRLLSTRECPGCNLRGAKLERADLQGVNLSNADLTGADLENANLTNANLRGANFTNADLEDANLTNADVTGANFQGADLEGVIGLRR